MDVPQLPVQRGLWVVVDAPGPDVVDLEAAVEAAKILVDEQAKLGRRVVTQLRSPAQLEPAEVLRFADRLERAAVSASC